jgi:hypothetical protein
MSDDPRERIRSLLVKVGDERKKVVGNLKGSVAIMKEDINEHRDTIMISLIECGKYLPTKAGVYGTWLALMNPDNRLFVSDSINGFYSELRYAVSDANLEVASCLLRVLIECANAGCLSLSSLVDMIRGIYTTAYSSGLSSGDFGVYMVTSSVCWFSPYLALNSSEVSSLIDEVVQGVEAWTSAPSYQTRKEIFNVIPGHLDQLESAVACIKALRENGWETDVLIRPYLMEGLTVPSFEPEFVHNLPTDHSALLEAVVAKKFVPSVFLRSSGARYLLEETMSSIIVLFGQSVGECAKALLRIPFMDPSFEPTLADVLISKSLRPSSAGFCQSAMHRVMILQESVRPAFEESVQSLLGLELSTDAQFALMETVVFAFMNNIPIKNVLSILPMDKFLTVASRLMPSNSIQAKLANDSITVPEPGQGNPFEASDDYSRVKEVVRIKDGSEVEAIELLVNRMEDKEKAFGLFVQAMLENGSRTVTHFSKLLDLYGSIIHRALDLNLVSSVEQREMTIVSKVFAFWFNNSFRLEKTLDILLNANLISVHTVITSMPIDADSLTTFRMIDLAFGFLVRRRRQQGSDMGETEYSLAVTANTLLSNCPEPVQRYIVRTYYADLDKTTVTSDLLALF